MCSASLQHVAFSAHSAQLRWCRGRHVLTPGVCTAPLTLQTAGLLEINGGPIGMKVA